MLYHLPSHCQALVDLLPHCGGNSESFYLTTLPTVDLASGWSECVEVFGHEHDSVWATPGTVSCYSYCIGLNRQLWLSAIDS